MNSASTPAAIRPTQNAFQRYFKTRGWKELLFFSLIFAAGYYVRHHYFITNHDKWLVRPHLNVPYTDPKSLPHGRSGMFPCFFFSGENGGRAPVTIDDCATLIPDGKQWNTVEVDPTGAVIPLKTDLYVPDVIPLAFTRTYGPIGEWEKKSQVYLPNVYSPAMYGSRYPYTYVDLYLPGGDSAHYDRISPGTFYSDAVFETHDRSPFLNRSRIAWNRWGWDIALTNGLTFLSPEAYNATRAQQCSIVAIFDSQGREARLRRELNGDLTDITSPNGHTIHLDYHGAEIVSGRNSAGDSVTYTYNSDHTISEATYSNRPAMHYSYNSGLRLTGIESPPGTPIFKADYVLGEAREVSTPGHLYRFEYHIERAPKDPGYILLREDGQPTTKLSFQRHGFGIWWDVTTLPETAHR